MANIVGDEGNTGEEQGLSWRTIIAGQTGWGLSHRTTQIRGYSTSLFRHEQLKHKTGCVNETACQKRQSSTPQCISHDKR